MAKQIFRKEALERMSSPEQLDELMPVTSQRGWLTLAGIAALLLAAALWSVFGSIETTVTAQGSLMRAGGLETVTAPAGGEISGVLVKVGDIVTAGQELLRLSVKSADEQQAAVTVRSEGEGRVLDVAVIAGESVAEGDVLISLESKARPLQAVLYVPTYDGYKVQARQRARIIPATANRDSSEYLVGQVTSAGRYPATRAAVFRGVQNEDSVEALTRNGPVLQVSVAFGEDEDLSQFFSGTPCRAEITIDREAPLNFVIPHLGSR